MSKDPLAYIVFAVHVLSTRAIQFVFFIQVVLKASKVDQ